MERIDVQPEESQMDYGQRIVYFGIAPPQRPVEGCTVFSVDPAKHLEAFEAARQDAGQADAMVGGAALSTEAAITFEE